MIYENYHANPDFAAYFIIWQDNAGLQPTPEFCDGVRQQYGLTMPVLIWANDQLAAEVGLNERHVDLVMERGSKIVFRSQFNDNSFKPVIEALLSQ